MTRFSPFAKLKKLFRSIKGLVKSQSPSSSGLEGPAPVASSSSPSSAFPLPKLERLSVAVRGSTSPLSPVSTSADVSMPLLPTELKEEVLGYRDQATLEVTSRVSLAFLELSAPLLYAHPTVNGYGGLEMLLVPRDSANREPRIESFLDLGQISMFTYHSLAGEGDVTAKMAQDPEPEDDHAYAALDAIQAAIMRLPQPQRSLRAVRDLHVVIHPDQQSSTHSSVLRHGLLSHFDPAVFSVEIPLADQPIGFFVGVSRWTRLETMKLCNTFPAELSYDDFLAQFRVPIPAQSSGATNSTRYSRRLSYRHVTFHFDLCPVWGQAATERNPGRAGYLSSVLNSLLGDDDYTWIPGVARPLFWSEARPKVVFRVEHEEQARGVWAEIQDALRAQQTSRLALSRNESRLLFVLADRPGEELWFKRQSTYTFIAPVFDLVDVSVLPFPFDQLVDN